jgi:ribosomal protein L40E
MGSLALTMLIVTVLYFICIGITPKSPVEPESAAAQATSSWECDTCGADNALDAQACSQCGMEQTV